MRRIICSFLFVFLLILACLVGCCNHLNCNSNQNNYYQSDLTELASQIEDYSVVFKKTSNVKAGSGVLLKGPNDSTFILTASHVWDFLYEDNSNCIYTCHDTDCICLVDEDIYAIDTMEDWIILQTDHHFENSELATFNDSFPNIGEVVASIGYPSGRVQLFTTGYVAGYSVLIEEPFPHILIQGYAYYGSSGSGVFNTKGELIGMITAIGNRTDPVMGLVLSDPNIVYAVPINEIEELIFGRSTRWNRMHNRTISNSDLSGILDIIR